MWIDLTLALLAVLPLLFEKPAQAQAYADVSGEVPREPSILATPCRREAPSVHLRQSPEP